MENAGREIDDASIKESMKDSGLGTPATRAAIIERLIEVGYAARKGKALTATDKGVQLIEVSPAELSSPETTGKWERALKLIHEGRMDENRFMQSIVKYTRYLVGYAPKRRARGRGFREGRTRL
jgi:DNA topoisomerase-3